jgi:CheY-like chemotaxis protein
VEQARFLLASRAFDAILTDAHLGDGSGLDLYRAVTAERPDLARCWVFMTGDVLGSEVAAFLRESQALHLSKPFELTDLLRTLARAAATDLLPVASGVDGIP